MKYEFTGKTQVKFGVTLRQVRYIATGVIGGWIEKEYNLSQEGAAQVAGDAMVWGDARVCGNARVYGDAMGGGNADLLLVGPIGSRKSFLTVTADARIKVRFTTGCFSGSLKDLQAKLKGDHSARTLYGKQYRAAIALAKVCVKAKKS